MKLNADGRKLYNTWWHNYCTENDRLGGNSANHDFVEGWCIIDNDDYVKTLADECGLLIFGYDTDTINVVNSWIEDYGNETIKIGSNEYTYEDIKNELMKYFET